MAGFGSYSIQRKLVTVIMATTLLALVLASATFFLFDIFTLRQRMVEGLKGLAATMEANTISALAFNDRQTAGEILSSLRVHPQVVAARIFDRDGAVFAQYQRQGGGVEPLPSSAGEDGHSFKGEHLVLRRTIRFGDEEIGTFYIDSDLGEIRERLRSYSGILLGVLLTVSLLAFLLSARLQRLISKPILELVEVERQVIERQDYSVRARRTTDDEIGLLIDAFNLMLSQIHARDEEITIARDRAEEANRSKSTFLANMSHELRTPLNAIIGYSEMLQEEAEDLGQEDFVPDLAKIQSAGKHLLNLINGVLDLSKIEAGRMELYLEPFSVEELVQGVQSTIKPLMEPNGNVFEVVAPVPVGTMHADLTKTRQILLNLLSNAAKFTAQGRVVLEVARKESQGKDWIRFRITDSGIGMTEEQIGKVFEPFSQADVSTTRQYGGTGLGLSICKRFSEMMGGDIFAESVLGQGSVFTVQLPVQVQEDAPEAGSVEPIKLVDSGKHHLPAYSTQKAPRPGGQVLVIDDDPVAHELLTDILTREGFHVTCCGNAEDGLAEARRLRPDLITLDVKMPGKDGWMLLAELKADPALEEIPVIMISVVEDRKTAYALGAADYLTKPVERSRLAALLARYRQSSSFPSALVVDDDPDARRLLRQQLEAEGWQVKEAENGVAALRRVTQEAPDLILLDLLMPELDGFGFLTELRKTSTWRTIPVLVVTAMDLGPEEVRKLNGGVEKVLQKGTFSLDQFKAEIRSLTSNLGR